MSWACKPSTRRCLTCLRRAAITYEDALRNADSVNNLRLQIKLHSQRAKSDLMAGTENFKVM